MNYSLRDAITYLILGIVFFAIAFVIIQLGGQYAIPYFAEFFEDRINMPIMIGFTAIIPCYIVKALFTYACIKLRVFVLGEKFAVVDGLIPILSDIKLKKLYLSMVTEVYIEDADGNPIEGVSKLKRWFIANVPNINIFFTLLFFLDMIGFAVFFIMQGTFNMFTIEQIAWLVSLLLIYNTTVTLRSIMLGITYKSMEDWIVSRNPIWFIVMPLVVPTISFIYLTIMLILALTRLGTFQQPFLNLVSLFGIAVFNPIVSAIHAKFAVDDSKRTVDEMRREAGEAPQIW